MNSYDPAVSGTVSVPVSGAVRAVLPASLEAISEAAICPDAPTLDTANTSHTGSLFSVEVLFESSVPLLESSETAFQTNRPGYI
jgi:hypothetical protein